VANSVSLLSTVAEEEETGEDDEDEGASEARLTLEVDDPDDTSVYIVLEEEDDDAAIAQALEQNQNVRCVELKLDSRNGNWDHFYGALARRGNLKELKLHGYGETRFGRLIRMSARRFRPILRAIQQNSALRKIEFENTCLFAADLCSFLDTASHVSELILSCALQGAADRAARARDVAAALQRNTNIVTLKLIWIDRFLDPILEGLVSNNCVRHLVVFSNFSRATCNLAGVLLRSNRSIRHLDLDGSFRNEEDEEDVRLDILGFGAVLEGVKASMLESFGIYSLDQRGIQVLADAIPSMKIPKLVLGFYGHDFGFSNDYIEPIKGTLRQAVKRNFTLQSVDLFNNNFIDEDTALKFYTERNIRLAALVEEPTRVPKHLWKEALLLAAKAGPETFFPLLCKIGPEVLTDGSRKRKRSGL